MVMRSTATATAFICSDHVIHWFGSMLMQTTENMTKMQFIFDSVYWNHLTVLSNRLSDIWNLKSTVITKRLNCFWKLNGVRFYNFRSSTDKRIEDICEQSVCYTVKCGPKIEEIISFFFSFATDTYIGSICWMLFVKFRISIKWNRISICILISIYDSYIKWS